MKKAVLKMKDKNQVCKDISYQVAIEAAHDGIIAINAEGIIVIFNKAAKGILGIDENSILDRHVNDIIPELWPNLRDSLATGLPQIDKEFRIGNLSIVANLTPIRVEGEIVGLTGMFQDSSKIEAGTIQLSAAQQFLSPLNAPMDPSYNGQYITDRQGNTLKVNLSFERITGIKSSELTGLIGRNLEDLVCEGYISKSVMLLVPQSGKAVTVNARTKDGRELLLTGNPVLDRAGKVSMVLTNVRDITDLHRLNRQLQESKQMTEEYQIKLQTIQAQQQDGSEIIVRSKAMIDVVDLALRIAGVDMPVLLHGETGVGKEVVARLIHHKSGRAKKGTFVKINCGAIPDHLLESELFGYERGAFTGASQTGKQGLFELADHGTLFLDEIEALSLNLQAKLLSVVQDLEVLPVGATVSKKIDTRIITASNLDLKKMVEAKTFREDLFFRLNVVPIQVPPLRDRKDDIVPLIIYFLNRYSRKYGRSKRFSRPAIDCLIQYHWPGNIRELGNVIERLVVTSKADDIVLDDLPLEVMTSQAALPNLDISSASSLKQAVEEFEYRFIEEAIQRYGNAKKAAEVLKVDPATVSRKIQRHRMDCITAT